MRMSPCTQGAQEFKRALYYSVPFYSFSVRGERKKEANGLYVTRPINTAAAPPLVRNAIVKNERAAREKRREASYRHGITRVFTTAVNRSVINHCFWGAVRRRSSSRQKTLWSVQDRIDSRGCITPKKRTRRGGNPD